MTCLDIQYAAKIEVDPVDHYPRKPDCEEFWTRRLHFHTEKNGVKVSVLLFAHSEDALYLPGETYPEREPVPDLKPVTAKVQEFDPATLAGVGASEAVL